MTWVKLDDKLHRNPKALASSDAAFKVWVLSWSYCADFPQPTGFLSSAEARAFVRGLGKDSRVIRELVDNRMWDQAEGGFLVHEFEQGLPPKSTERVRAWREKKRAESVTATVSPGVAKPLRPVSSHARAVPEPDPVPVPVPEHGDKAGGLSFHDAAASLVAPVDRDVTALCEWFLNKRGWESFASMQAMKHERVVASQMLGVMPLTEVLLQLNTWWAESDPDDRPASLEYFWTRLQDEQHQRLKQEGRSHVRTDELSRIDPAAAATRAWRK